MRNAKTTPNRGFSLVEMLVVMAMMGMLMAGLSLVFSRSSYLARAQTEQAAMQQALRVSQHEMTRFLRMAGAGGMPITWTVRVPDDLKAAVTKDTMGSFPANGFAVAVNNNIATGTTIPSTVTADVTPHYVIPGSDMLTVRGVFTTPVYYFGDPVTVQDWVDSTDDTLGGDEPGEAEIQIPNRVAGSFGVPLDPLIEKLTEAKADGVPIAFLLRDLGNPDAYFVVEWDAARTSNADLSPVECNAGTAPSSWADEYNPEGAECITVHVKLDSAGEAKGAEFANLSMGNNLQSDAGSIEVTLPSEANRATLPIPKQVGSIGVLEEYRFYVRAEWEVPGDTTSRLTPVLTRAEYVPGTDVMVDRIDIVQNTLDLQIAIGIETNSEIGAAGFANVVDQGDTNDEVLFNDPNDKVDNPDQLAHLSPQAWYNPELEYHYLRVTTVAQAGRPTIDNWVPRIGTIEDVDRRQSFEIDGKTYNYNTDRLYQRSYLQTIVEMRNLK